VDLLRGYEAKTKSNIYILNSMPKQEPQCTCREDQKQRQICPVCDKEEYEKQKSISLDEELKKDKK
jgi:hypothetical protein